MDEESVTSLQALGFTELEAAIYTFLLQESPATGYRVAQAIGKPTANTYKAIATLEGKGAVLVDEGSSRLCRAVPHEELLNQIERRFSAARALALEALSQSGAPQEDERVYQLRTRDQVMARARCMITDARSVVIMSAGPRPLEELRPELEAAVARGVAVILKGYLPYEMTGAQVAVSRHFEGLLDRLPGEEISLCVDALEVLTALLARTGEGVVQAIWSGSVFLAFNHYNGLFCEWVLTALADHLDLAGVPEPVRTAMTARPHPLETPGFHQLAAHKPS